MFKNIFKMSKFGSKIALTLVAVLSLVGFMSVAVPAEANQDPAGCTSPGVGIFLAVYRSDEVTPISGGQSAAVGETIKYRATLTHSGAPVCNYEGGTLTITTPDGVVNDVTPGGGIPLISSGSPFTSAFVSYVVQSADIGVDADLDASTSYTGGQSHTGSTHDPVNAGTAISTPLKGKIIVEKQTLPDGSSQLFAFTGAVAGSIPDGQTLELEVNPGQYTSTETPIPAGWSLTSIVCNDANSSGVVGTGVATFNVESNETVTCVFTNTQNGRIIVDKVTDPSGSSQSFNFDATGAGYNDFSLTDTAAANSQSVVPGAYSVSEGAVAGWTQTSATCDQGETIGSIDVGPGETVTCTFVNTIQQAHLTLQKTVINDNGGTALDTAWTLSASGPTPISGVEGNSAVTNATVNAGTYNLSESVGPAGYTNGTTWVCTTGTGVTQDDLDTLTLAPGASATCTITNNDNAPKLTLNKIVVNNNGGTASESAWTLSATGPTTISGPGAVGSADVVSGASFDVGTYVLSESTGPADYGASGWTCSNGDNDGTISVALGDDITCTITNDDILRTGHIIIDKVTLPGGDPQSFSFDATGTGYNDFSLTDQGGTNDQTLNAGTYSVAETAVSGWTQTSATCSDGSLISAIELSAGETVTCTFTNTYTPPQWCSPGYWRQEQHFDSWPAGYSTSTPYLPSPVTLSKKAVKDGATAAPTLLQVLQSPQWYGGDAFNAVGDLLSGAHSDINFTGERVEDSCPLN